VNGPVEPPYIELSVPIGNHDPELTFRDPAGQLLLTDRFALRRIYPGAVDVTRKFLASPLCASLEASGDLIRSKIANVDEHSRIVPGEFWLEHPRIAPISYPWEWTAAQWRAAAELTLRIAREAIDAGWTLKDATPLNILFAGTRPVLVDVLSFEPRDPHSSVWLAYGQFVRTFLLPLTAAKYLSWPLQATFFWRDGYEPDLIYKALGPWKRLSPNLLDVVTLAALLERPSKSRESAKKSSSISNPELATHILQKRIARLGKQIRRTAKARGRSEWSEYAQSASHYQPGDAHDKQEFVKNVLQRHGPSRILDIGANTGTYSLIASDAGAEVVALDSDEAALEVLWNEASKQERPITALVANIARPTPAAGWRNLEQLSLLDRLAGRFDMVLMLAVIHHLILREQVPLARIAELCALLTRRWLLLEWVPPSDPMFQEWLHGRDDLYDQLTEDDLQRAFSSFFAVADRSELGNGRVLFLFVRTPIDDGARALGDNECTEAGPS
jgi:2-polyprenyl-3-methyl-5-hydroxy-6-metoxy-1,4-benzoquinol methylase